MILNALKTFLGKIIIPKNILNDDLKILHISDTPSFIFSEIANLISALDPDYIIHTGDVSDDVKLELFPWKKDIYQNNIKRFSSKLSKVTNAKLIFCVGNHDDKEILDNYFGSENVFIGANSITIDKTKVSFSHYVEEIEKLDCDFYLFGHNTYRLSSISNGKFYLNGIQGINVINLKTLEITSLKYPLGTDDSRQMKRKIGL
ncbi:MAG: metallophosphoesterase [Acidaminobacteraceae bacterium]